MISSCINKICNKYMHTASLTLNSHKNRLLDLKKYLFLILKIETLNGNTENFNVLSLI